MADDQHNWPAWDADKEQRRDAASPDESAAAADAGDSGNSGDSVDAAGDAGNGVADLDQPTTAIRGHLSPEDLTRAYHPTPARHPGRDESSEATQYFPPAGSFPSTDYDATTAYTPVQRPGGYLPDDATQAIPQVRDSDDDGLSLFDEPTERAVEPVAAGGIYRADDEPPAGPNRRLRSGLGRAMMVTGAVLGVLVLAYAVDLLVSWGDVPRGVTVAGVDVGGMSRADAEQKLRQELQPRFDEPVKVTAGDVQTTLNPAESGLGVDWQGTLEQAGKQPWSPFTRLTSFWDEREVGIVGKSDEPTLKKAVQRIAAKEINHKKREGNITFKNVAGSEDDVTPVAVQPRQGQELGPIEDAMATIEDTWLQLGGVRLVVDSQPVKATSAGVKATLEELVEPAVSGPIEVKGNGVTTSLSPREIGKAFEFTPSGDGSLKATVDQESLKDALADDLKPSEKEGADAEIVFTSGKPTVKPAKAGSKVDWKKTLKPYLDVIKKSEDRTLKVSYTKKNPDVTTTEAKKLGIKEVIGEFTTGGFSPDSGINIRTVAQDVDGAIVKPGETFSLNGFTGPRTAASGYVEAGIIQNGVPGRAVGGGISQFATTLYNATYFAGLKDAGHKEHSYYISRYPIAREATVFQGAAGEIDIAFTNDAETGVAIQTLWSPDSLTVKIWGTKRYRVDSQTSAKSNVKEPGKQTLTTSKCEPSPGIPGFTATDTRILYDIDSGNEVRRETRTTQYNSKPEIVCKRKDGD